MKKQSLITIAWVAASLISTATLAADGTLSFTGEIRDSTCSIGTGGTQSETIPALAKSNLSTIGDFGPQHGFNIELSGTECAGTSVQISFEQDPTKIENGMLVNTDTTTGDHVGVELLDGTGTLINLDDTSYKTTPVAISGTNTASIPLRARYKAKTDSVVAGPVNASVGILVSIN